MIFDCNIVLFDNVSFFWVGVKKDMGFVVFLDWLIEMGVGIIFLYRMFKYDDRILKDINLKFL